MKDLKLSLGIRKPTPLSLGPDVSKRRKKMGNKPTPRHGSTEYAYKWQKAKLTVPDESLKKYLLG
ncbi:hypothetical protein FRB94_008724 [Tulasnella sp. JGI-2019a]|nr:hypothetical protein FRB94_008724 [Tulasnella sp. JGI-2019a]